MLLVATCVLAKLGMMYEGLLRQFRRKGEACHGVVMMTLPLRTPPCGLGFITGENRHRQGLI
jgi:hypothetical protein